MPERDDLAYDLGRLFAVLEHSGGWAHPAAADLAYGAMRANPAATLAPAFARVATKGAAAREAVEEIAQAIPTLPATTMTPEAYGDFGLGYLHQGARMRGNLPPDSVAAQKTDVLIIRISPDLKAWTMEQGGSDFVRRLLHRERQYTPAVRDVQ